MDKKERKAIYFECYGGISGDMTVAALLDMGADEKELRRQLDSLPLEGFSVEISRVKKSGLDCCDFNVVLEEQYHNHDHDIVYLYGHRQGDTDHAHIHDHNIHSHDHEHSRDIHGHEHSHDIHGHEEHSHHADHVHRGLKDVTGIIDQSSLTKGAKKIAVDIFRVLAEAEAKAHGAMIETVHFHEVGAVDSIVDIAAAAICLDNLGIQEIIVPELYEGRGTIRCAHGILPIPVPAVMHIVADHGIAMHITNVEAELVTPTGAAIVAAVRTADKLPERYTIKAVGMGAGKRDYKRASILRTMIIECPKEEQAEYREPSRDHIYKLESNIDDCTGEALGYVMERLLAEGARDVSYTPVFMKKNRPAYQINIICTQKDIAAMEEILFKETTTIGIRRMKVERTVLEREVQKIMTSLGEAQIKVCNACGALRIYPEYESVAAIAAEKKLAYREVWEKVFREAESILL